MKKAIAALLAVVMITAVIDVAVAAAAASTTNANALQQTKIMITNYPKQVKVNQEFEVTGRLTSDDTGLGNKVMYYLWQDNNGTWWRDPRVNFTTNADGSFTDTSSYNIPGTYNGAYKFPGDDQYATSKSDIVTITATS